MWDYETPDGAAPASPAFFAIPSLIKNERLTQLF
jgi:hypothetical protein